MKEELRAAEAYLEIARTQLCDEIEMFSKSAYGQLLFSQNEFSNTRVLLSRVRSQAEYLEIVKVKNGQ